LIRGISPISSDMPVKESSTRQLPFPLEHAADMIFHPLNYQITKFEIESESQEYSACTFELNGLKIKHRLSKITPNKTGQFVTIWKRNEAGITTPFDNQDDFDLVIISAKSGDHFGQFIFPKALLAHYKIITKNGVDGKRGIRVYPPWDTATNKQAEKTQKWQIAYFLPIDTDRPIDFGLVKKLIDIQLKT